MRIDLDLGDVEAFVAVAERASFHLAAQDLALSPSAVSRRVARLEERLGVRLLERTSRRVALTPAGRAFLARGRELLQSASEAVLAVGEENRRGGLVTLAAVFSSTRHLVPEALARFRTRHPQVRVRLEDLYADEVVEAVLSGRADLGITFVGPDEAEVLFEPLFEEPFVVALPRGHPLAAREVLRWRDLAGEPLVAVWKGSGNRVLLDAALARGGLSLGWAIQVRHSNTALSLVEAGLGIAVVPRSTLPPRAGPLVWRPLVEPRVRRTLGIVRVRGRPLTALAEALRRCFHELAAAGGAPPGPIND